MKSTNSTSSSNTRSFGSRSGSAEIFFTKHEFRSPCSIATTKTNRQQQQQNPATTAAQHQIKNITITITTTTTTTTNNNKDKHRHHRLYLFHRLSVQVDCWNIRSHKELCVSALHVHNACTGASRGNDAITADRVGFYDDSSAHKFCTLVVTLIQRCHLGPGQLFNCNVAWNKRPAVNTVVVVEKNIPRGKSR